MYGLNGLVNDGLPGCVWGLVLVELGESKAGDKFEQDTIYLEELGVRWSRVDAVFKIWWFNAKCS